MAVMMPPPQGLGVPAADLAVLVHCELGLRHLVPPLSPPRAWVFQLLTMVLLVSCELGLRRLVPLRRDFLVMVS